MFVALDKNKNRVWRSEAEKGKEYFCPECQRPVIFRKGIKRSPHFAHKNGSCTDLWSYDITDWNRMMKEHYDVENREIVLNFKGEIHRADVLINGCVIEFQKESITAKEYVKRNNFFKKCGYKVAWVIDASNDFISGKLSKVKEGEYAWKGYKRYLLETDYSNVAIILYLNYFEDSNTEYFGKVISLNKNGRLVMETRPAIRLGKEYSLKSILLNNKEKVEDLLAGKKYKSKIIGEPEHSKDAYLCKKTNSWCSISDCRNCEYAIAIEELPKNKDNKCYRIYCSDDLVSPDNKRTKTFPRIKR